MNGQNQKFAPFAVLLICTLFFGAVGGIGGMYFWQKYSKTTPVNVQKNINEKLILEESSAVIDAAKKVSPAVVSISSKSNARDFFGQVYTQEGGGTGFIITNDGLILTNKHVVSDANATYTVFTQSGKDYQAKVLSLDPMGDLAILKIEATGLPVIELGDSDNLKIGQWIIAIGNALGEFQNTVTVGVISAKDRKITASDQSGNSQSNLEGLLQTDAAINPGNSGGPLVNLKGQVVGINVAKASGSGAENIGFAIPINSAMSAIDSVKKTGKIVRPYLGIRYIPVTKEVAKVANLSIDYGVLVSAGSNQEAVVSGSPAAKAGIKENDVITAINGERIDENHSLGSIIQKYQPDNEVELTVLRDGKESKVKVKLGTAQ